MNDLLRKLAEEVNDKKGEEKKGVDKKKGDEKKKPPFMKGNGGDQESAAEDAGESGEEGGEQPPVASEGTEAVPANGQPTNPTELNKKLFDFFSQNPNPADSDVHAFAEQNGIPPDQVETAIYTLSTLLVQLLRGGKSIEKNLDPTTVDPQQLEMGMEIEKEHIDNPVITKKIALDHLAEDPQYYTHLKEMEDAAKQGQTQEQQVKTSALIRRILVKTRDLPRP